MPNLSNITAYAPTAKQVWGRRDELAQLDALLSPAATGFGGFADGGLLLIQGQGGVGKSRLIEHCSMRCAEWKRPVLRVDAQNMALPNEGETFLRALCKGEAQMASLRLLEAGEVGQFLRRTEDELGQHGGLVEAIKEWLRPAVDDGQAQTTGLISLLAKAVFGVLARDEKRREAALKRDLAAQPESVLLAGLMQEGRRWPVLLIDTFEQSLPVGREMVTTIDTEAALSGHMQAQALKQRALLGGYLAGLVRLLAGRGWTVIAAGRHFPEPLLAQGGSQMLLQGLDISCIEQNVVAPLLAEHQQGLPPQASLALATAVQLATFGGLPVWLHAMRKALGGLLRRGESALALANSELLAQAIDDKSSLLSAALREAAAGDLSRAWRLALPSTLTPSRWKALFPVAADRRQLQQVFGELGLFKAAQQGDPQLHEDVRALLRWWAREQGLDDSAAARADHNALLVAMKHERPDLADLSWLKAVPSAQMPQALAARHRDAESQNWARDATLHALAGSERLRQIPAGKSRQFTQGLTRSISLGWGQKWHVAEGLESLSGNQLTELVDAWVDETAQFEDLFGASIANDLSRDVAAGLAFGIDDGRWWRTTLQRHGHALQPNAQWSEIVLVAALALTSAGLLDDAHHWRCRFVDSCVAARGSAALDADTLMAWAMTLGALDRSREEIACYQDLLRRFGEAEEPALREQVAKVLVNQGIAHGQLGEGREAIACYQDLLRRFGEAEEPALREQVAKALFNQGFGHGQLGEGREEIACYQDLLQRFGEAEEPALREQVAKALFNQGFRHGQLGEGREAIACYQDLLRRFGEADEPALREQVAKALFNQGIAHGQLGEGREEIACYQDLLRRFGEADEPALREQVAKVLVNQGIAHGQLGEGREAIACYQDLLRRFGEADEPALRGLVAKAHNGTGFTLLMDAKQRAGSTAPTDFQANVRAARGHFQAAEQLAATADRGMVLGNLAYADGLLGDAEAARTGFAAALLAGGQDLYDGTVADLQTHPVPADEALLHLLRTCWSDVRQRSNVRQETVAAKLN